MKISNLRAKRKGVNTELSVKIERSNTGTEKLWFSVPDRFSEYFSTDRMDGFLVGMLFPAMVSGEDISLEGRVSRKLLFNINNHVIPLLMSYSPSCKKIKVYADEVFLEKKDVSGVGSGFSGGVDSFCTIYDRFEIEDDPGYKINKLLFLNVGSHGAGQGGLFYFFFVL
jgi:hypothetical protein